jgi:dihydrofolate reductase
MAANRVIGRHGTLPWHLPDDLKFFKSLTLGHPVVMGRKTFASIGRPLPGRRNIVLSRPPADGAAAWSAPGIEVVPSAAALTDLGLTGRVFVIGGAEIYRLLLPHCSSIIVSRLRAAYDGDTTMPPFENEFSVADRLATYPEFEVWEYRRPHAAADPATDPAPDQSDPGRLAA